MHSQEFKEALTNWTTHTLTLFDITAWEVNLMNVPPDSRDAGASVRCIYGRKVAELCLCADFFDYSSEKQQKYLVHEFTHIVLNSLDEHVSHNDLNVVMGMPAFTMFISTWTTVYEHMTEQLSLTLYDFLRWSDKNNALWDLVIKSEKEN